MKTLLNALFALTLVSVSASAESYTYKCRPFRSNDNAFLADGYAIVTVSKNALRFKHYDVAGGGNQLLRDYSYINAGLQGGKGAVKDFLRFNLSKENRGYGDLIQTLYIEPSLVDGGTQLRGGDFGGRMTFTGQGFSYDWNLCVRQ